jgi:hypothetical protein
MNTEAELKQMSETALATAAADLLTRYWEVLKADLAKEINPSQQEFLKSIIKGIPNATLLLGLAAGDASKRYANQRMALANLRHDD